MLDIIKRNINSNEIKQEDLINYIVKNCELFNIPIQKEYIPIIIQMFQSDLFNLKEAFFSTLDKMNIQYNKLYSSKGDLIKVIIYE